jgi:hypothetical protein
MKGTQRTRTRAQNLAEIVQKQGGFLTGLNTDSPKSDVGDTQVTVLENAIPFRDRIDARGGLKPTTKYKTDAAHDESLFSQDVTTKHYDEDWDEIFYFNNDSKEIEVTGTKVITKAILLPPLVVSTHVKFIRAVDKLIVCFDEGADWQGYIIEDRGTDYFLRLLSGIDNPNIQAAKSTVFTQPAYTSPETYIYAWRFSWLRIVDGVVVAESLGSDFNVTPSSIEPDGVIAPFSISPVGISNTIPLGYVIADPDNHYTHIRFYRTEHIENYNVSTFISASEAYYKLVDYELDTYAAIVATTTPAGLNNADNGLSIGTPLWQDGYQPMPTSTIADTSNAMLLVKREGSEINYCPIMSGDAQKYLGYYNPLYQFSRGVNGEVTLIKDVGNGCLVTTKDRSYYIDTASKIEDEGQRSLAIYTPILADVAMLNKNIGVELNQRKAVVEANEGSLMGFTSDGAIRHFSNLRWGVDLAKDKMHSITKGLVKEYGLQCSANFSNDAYYLTYVIASNTFNDSEYNKYYTLRLGTTEESGFGFAKFTGEPDADEPALRDELGDVAGSLAYAEQAKGWPFIAPDTIGDTDNAFLVIKDVLYVLRRDVRYSWNALLEYTGDKFDKKMNKDVVDGYNGETATYDSTVYYDINAEIEFPEVTPESEGDFLYFLRANFYLRADRFSYKVTSEATKGYEIDDSNIEKVSLSDTEFSMDARAGEGNDIKASNEAFEPTKSVVLRRDVQDHRIRLTLRADSAGFQLTGMESHYKRDIRKNIGDTDTQTDIEALNTDMFVHINETIANLCVGATRSSTFDIGAPIEGAFIGHSPLPQIEGASPSLTTGPTGENDAIVVNSDMEFETIPPIALTGATLMLWRKVDDVMEVKWGWNSNNDNYYVIDVDGTTLTFYVISNYIKTILFTDTDATEWLHYAIIYNAGWKLYKSGIEIDTSAEALETFLNYPSLRTDGIGTFADLRAYNKALTEEQLNLYYNNFLNEDGDYTNGY